MSSRAIHPVIKPSLRRDVFSNGLRADFPRGTAERQEDREGRLGAWEEEGVEAEILPIGQLTSMYSLFPWEAEGPQSLLGRHWLLPSKCRRNWRG